MICGNQEKYKRHLTLAQLKEMSSRNNKIYIYGNGGAGRWLWRSLRLTGIDVEAFIDTDVKKITENFGFQTIGIIESQVKVKKDDLIIIGAVDIHEVLTVKDQTDLKDIYWMSLGEFARENLESGALAKPEEFDEYTVGVVMDCHSRLLDPSDLFLRSVDIMITEKCSLKCQDCANLMQYYEKPKDVKVDEIMASIRWLLNSVDGVYEFRLIGGEPFMNKLIYEIIEKILSFDGFEKLVIYTNGMIPLKENYRDLMTEEKIIFSVTDYGALAKNTNRFVQQLEEWGCTYRVHPPEHWTDSGRIKKQNRTAADNQKLFDECCGKNLWTLSDRGFGRCPFAINAAHLGAIDFGCDSVVAVGENEKLNGYIQNNEFLTACDLCNGRSFSSPQIVPAIQTKIPLKMEL